MAKKTKKYETLYQKSHQKEEFIKALLDNILQGEELEEDVLAQLDVLEKHGDEGKDLLFHIKDHNDDSILNLTAKFHENTSVVKRILEICPRLILVCGKGDYEDQTILHIAICKRNCNLLKLLFNHPFVKKRKRRLLETCATGCRFEYTVMMGELPFSVAALTLDEGVLDLLLQHGGFEMISWKNSFGDTVFHSLIKYARLHPSNVKKIIATCDCIHNYLNIGNEMAISVWFEPNYANQTPLQLAVYLEQVDIFKFILNISGVYRCLDSHDGLFDIHLYDITELDTVALTRWMNPEKKNRNAKVAPKHVEKDTLIQKMNNPFGRFKKENVVTRQQQRPVLETICKIEVDKAFDLIKTTIVRDIIKKKWLRYRWVYWIWAFFHILYMTLLTWFAVDKTEYLKTLDPVHVTNQNTSSLFQCFAACVQRSTEVNPDPPVNPSPTNIQPTYFRIAMSILNLCMAILILGLEVRRRVYQKHRFNLKQLHHNGSYRILLCLFAISLAIDSIWFLVAPDNNFLLVLAILIGWFFLTFFLRAFKKFSFFTVMLQKVLVGDAVRFGVIILIEFLAFTVVMYITFLYTQPEGFRTIGETVLTMFNLMLGITELDVLNEAKHPWMAITLFVMFLLVTYVLMLNTLIAMMSQTCATVSENKEIQGELQRLSVTLFLENMLPNSLKVSCGIAKNVDRYDLTKSKFIQEERYYMEIQSLQDKYPRGSSILQRRDLLQTIKRDTHNILPDGVDDTVDSNFNNFQQDTYQFLDPQMSLMSPTSHQASSERRSNSEDNRSRSRSRRTSRRSREKSQEVEEGSNVSEETTAKKRIVTWDSTDGLHNTPLPEISRVDE